MTVEFDLFKYGDEYLVVGDTPDTVVEWDFPTVLSALRFVRKWGRDRKTSTDTMYVYSTKQPPRHFVFNYKETN